MFMLIFIFQIRNSGVFYDPIYEEEIKILNFDLKKLKILDKTITDLNIINELDKLQY